MSLRDLDLTPRAVAALVFLRKGPRSISLIADAIGDSSTMQTVELLDLLCKALPSAETPWTLLQKYPTTTVPRYGLTHDGLGWLQLRGLDATPAAKQALYDATDAQQAVRP